MAKKDVVEFGIPRPPPRARLPSMSWDAALMEKLRDVVRTTNAAGGRSERLTFQGTAEYFARLGMLAAEAGYRIGQSGKLERAV